MPLYNSRMKQRTVFVWLAIFTTWATGQLQAQFLAVSPEVYAQTPWRISNGKLYDLSLSIKDKLDPRGGDGFGTWFSGEVVQVFKDGILLQLCRHQGGTLIHVGNYPTAGVVDGNRVEFFAVPAGTYKYTTTGGSVSTVKNVDVGRKYNPVTDRATNMLRFTVSGVMSIPLTNSSRN